MTRIQSLYYCNHDACANGRDDSCPHAVHCAVVVLPDDDDVGGVGVDDVEGMSRTMTMRAGEHDDVVVAVDGGDDVAVEHTYVADVVMRLRMLSKLWAREQQLLLPQLPP